MSALWYYDWLRVQAGIQSLPADNGTAFLPRAQPPGHKATCLRLLNEPPCRSCAACKLLLLRQQPTVPAGRAGTFAGCGVTSSPVTWP